MLDFITAHLDLIGVALGCASLLLHYIAPRTKTQIDDKVLEAVDFAKDKLPKPPAPPAE